MKLFQNLSAWPESLRGGALSIGNFDGVHRGHAKIVEALCRQARSARGPAIILTFDPHPARLLRPAEAPPPLTWLERKTKLLGDLGVDVVVAYPTDQELLHMSPRDFFDQIVRIRLGVRRIVEGPNFRFGHDRAGTVEVLRLLADEARINLEIAPPLFVDGQIVSSTRVRRLLGEGKVDRAAGLLTEPYRIRGAVVSGAGRGTKLGFPTANLEHVDTMIPSPGVYAGRAFVGQQEVPAAIHVGPNPTFGERRLKVEVHLLSWSEPLGGLSLEVDFRHRLRDICQFGSAEELQRQLALDVEETRRRMAG